MRTTQRYGPFLVLLGVLTAVVIALPSRGRDAVTTGGPFGVGNGSTAAAGPVTSVANRAGGGGVTATSGPNGAGQTGGGDGAPGGAAVVAQGDTTHCVDGRQFGGLATAPPCMPRFTGDNGGATYDGVTGDTIEVVAIRPPENPVVITILKEVGLYSTFDQVQTFLNAAATFVNQHFELYGRRVHITLVQDNCNNAPPDVACLRTEANTIVDTYHPFAVFGWIVNSGDFMDQFSRRGVVNWGSQNFTDSYSLAHRPYHYDLWMGGDSQADLAAEYWCKRLAGGVAAYAGSDTLRSTPRRVGILAVDSPEYAPSAERLRNAIAGCDGAPPVLYLYAQDTTTANAQVTTLITKMRNDRVTSLIWMTDAASPVVFSQQLSAQSFFPENIIAGSGLVDYDLLARLYDPQQWNRAFGLGDLAAPRAIAQSDSQAVFTAGGGDGQVFTGAEFIWSYLLNVAYGIQKAGPTLAPASFESGLLSSPPLGGWARFQDPTVPLYQFGPQKYTAQADVRELYWDPHAVSAVDGKSGAYVSLNDGRRYTSGELPAGPPSLPPR